MLLATVKPSAGRRLSGAGLARLLRDARVMLAAAKGGELSLLLTGDREMRRLNRDFRGKDRPTDVLAFALHEGTAGELSRRAGLLGDVVLSVDTAARQARERGHALEDELVFLFAHGLCHLLGYDHNDDDEERKMNARMAKLLRRAGRRTDGLSRRVPSRGDG